MMSLPRTLGAVVVVLLCAAGLSACEDKQVTRYEPGKYSGQPVSPPWDSPHYSGKKADWEAAVQARAQAQNDYARIPAK
jgi:hypothetical protein